MLESRLYPWLHTCLGGWGLEAWTSGTRLPAISAHPGRQRFQFPLRKTHWTFDRSTSVDLDAHPVMEQKRGRKRMTPSPSKKGGGENEDPILVILGEGIYTPQIAPPTFHQRKIQNEGFMLKCCWFLLASKLADCIWFTVLCLMVSNRCFLVILRWLGRWWSGIPFQYLPHVHIKIVLGVPKSFNIFQYLSQDLNDTPLSPNEIKPITHLCMSRCTCYWEIFSWKCWLAEQYRHLWATTNIANDIGNERRS